MIDSLGNVSGMRGFGAPRHAGFVDFGQFARDGELFSASFTAVLIPRRAWEAVGPLDERYGYYYEDVDWSLRARMGGLYVLPAPHALVYHEGSASIGTRPSAYKLRLVTRNRVLWAGKVLRMRNSIGFARRYALGGCGAARRCGARGRRDDAIAIARAWLDVAVRAPSIYAARQSLRQWHVVPDENLFRAAATGPPLLDGALPRIDAASDPRALRAPRELAQSLLTSSSADAVHTPGRIATPRRSRSVPVCTRMRYQCTCSS